MSGKPGPGILAPSPQLETNLRVGIVGVMEIMRIIHRDNIRRLSRYVNTVVIGHRAGTPGVSIRKLLWPILGDANLFGGNPTIIGRRGGKMQQRRLFDHAEQTRGQALLTASPTLIPAIKEDRQDINFRTVRRATFLFNCIFARPVCWTPTISLLKSIRITSIRATSQTPPSIKCDAS